MQVTYQRSHIQRTTLLAFRARHPRRDVVLQRLYGQPSCVMPLASCPSPLSPCASPLSPRAASPRAPAETLPCNVSTCNPHASCPSPLAPLASRRIPSPLSPLASRLALTRLLAPAHSRIPDMTRPLHRRCAARFRPPPQARRPPTSSPGGGRRGCRALRHAGCCRPQ